MKAAFSNWRMKYNGDRINLALIRTLRNRSNKETKATLRKLTPKNDHVKNKDRQDPSSVLTLCNTKLTTDLKDVGYVCHTIISELDRYSPDTQLGMFPKPISIAIPSSGWIAFLSYELLVSFLTPFPSIVKEQVILLSLPMKHSPLSASVKSFWRGTPTGSEWVLALPAPLMDLNDSAPRDDHGKAWHSHWVYIPATLHRFLQTRKCRIQRSQWTERWRTWRWCKLKMNP